MRFILLSLSFINSRRLYLEFFLLKFHSQLLRKACRDQFKTLCSSILRKKSMQNDTLSHQTTNQGKPTMHSDLKSSEIIIIFFWIRSNLRVNPKILGLTSLLVLEKVRPVFEFFESKFGSKHMKHTRSIQNTWSETLSMYCASLKKIFSEGFKINSGHCTHSKVVLFFKG